MSFANKLYCTREIFQSPNLVSPIITQIKMLPKETKEYFLFREVGRPDIRSSTSSLSDIRIEADSLTINVSKARSTNTVCFHAINIHTCLHRTKLGQ